MAGGIDWLRWHHGSVTDPKFQLVARKSGASLPDVLAVWAYVLEQASANHDRGCYGQVDCEAVDCLFNFPPTQSRTADILKAMEERCLLAEGRVVAWEKRQPKREDDTAAERKRRQREREHELQMAAAVTHAASRNVTQGHADVTRGHDRGEERREEVIPLSSASLQKEKPARKRAAAAQLVSVDAMVAEGVDPQHAADWLVARAKKTLPLTPTAWQQTKEEAAKANLTIAEAIKTAAGNGWAGFKAAWLAADRSANGASRLQHETPRQAAAIDRVIEMTGGMLNARRLAPKEHIDAEHTDIPALG